MAAFYHIDKERKLVMSTVSGVLTSNDLTGHMQRLLRILILIPVFPSWPILLT